jgi:hypothetical protein
MAAKISLSNNSNKKRTSIGHSTSTRYVSKNDRRNKKTYRGQGWVNGKFNPVYTGK